MTAISTGTPKRYKNYNYFFYNPNDPKKIFIEFGGKTIYEGFKLVRLLPASKIQDDNVTIIGPDLGAMEVGLKHTMGILIDVYGSELVNDIEASLEIRIGEFLNFTPGLWDRKCGRYLWLRVEKTRFKSLHTIGIALNRLFKAEIPLIEKIQTAFYIGKNKKENS